MVLAILLGIRRGGSRPGRAAPSRAAGLLPAPTSNHRRGLHPRGSHRPTLQVAGGLDYLSSPRADAPRTRIASRRATFLTVRALPGPSSCHRRRRAEDADPPGEAMAVSSVAAQMGITASPVAAAETTFSATVQMARPSRFDIVKITLPAGSSA
jgi:hypothetical protein